MNASPLQSGITGGFSPRELMTGLTVNFTKNCTVDVGAYVESSTDAIITDGNNDRIHACIALGPSGNIQGYINWFDLDTGRVVVRRIFKKCIWTERLLRKANTRGKKDKKTILKGQIKFLNRKGKKFDWDNDNLTEIKTADREPKLVQPNFIAEIPGIEVESDYEPIIWPKPNTEPEVKSSYAERAKMRVKMLVERQMLWQSPRPEEWMMMRMMLQLQRSKNLMTSQMEECIPGPNKKRSKLKNAWTWRWG